LLGLDRRVEVKSRRRGYAGLYRALGEHDLLIVQRNHDVPLVVLRLSFAIELARAAERNKPGAP
jgi:hypothetical protein